MRQMPRRTLITMFAASLAICLLAGTGVAPADAALAFVPCANASGFSCASLTVPLDRSGKTPGTIALTVERKAASAAPGQSAVIALAGGPGQAADPLGELLGRTIAPALTTRDLLVFDQRGERAFGGVFQCRDVAEDRAVQR